MALSGGFANERRVTGAVDMKSAVDTAAKKLAAVLQRVTKKTRGLSDQALNAAAASLHRARAERGQLLPAEYVRRRVSLLLAELEDLARIAEEHHEPPASITQRLGALLGSRSYADPGVARAAVDAHLRTYCIARGSGTEWKRPSGIMKRAG
jgi:hypothetical protein